MVDNLLGAGAEATSCAQWAGERADNHVNAGRVAILVLRDAAAGAAEDAKGPGFVEDEAEFVAEFELDLEGGETGQLGETESDTITL